MSLLQETRALLKADDRTLDEIARAAGVGREWLSKLSQGRMADPGVTKIERLNAALKGPKTAPPGPIKVFRPAGHPKP